MKRPIRYTAYWVPGLDADIDPDVSLAHGMRWLAQAEKESASTGLIVMYAKSMMDNRPLLGQAAERWEFVSPRTRFHSSRTGRGPVLVIWPPDDKTLELAETLAFDSSLCVIPGSLYDVSPWIRRSKAECLVEGFDVEESEPLPAEIAENLDSLLFFGGHNSFLGGGEKEHAIRRLRLIARRRDAPTREAIEEYLRASGETDGDGASRVGRWYEEIHQGKRHRDYRGRRIR